VDNFCWPNIKYNHKDNPDGKFKAAQLVRSCLALRDTCLAYEIPLLSGKDSMYVDGHLPGRYGQTHKVSALETLQFSSISVINDIKKCVTMDSKVSGDLVYILGITGNELGGSEYYEHLGYTGLNVPKIQPEQFKKLYKALAHAINEELVASAHGIYRGGLCVHLAMVAMGGNLGMQIDLGQVSVNDVHRNDTILFSESAGRFIVTIDPENRESFENILKGHIFACVGTVTENQDFILKGLDDKDIINIPVKDLKAAWKKTFGDLF